MKHKYKTLVKDTLIFGLGKIGSRIILFLLVPLYTNYMSTSDYGTADFVFTISQLIVPVVSVVIFDAVIRFGLQKGVDRQDVLLASFLVLGASTAIVLAITPLFGLYRPVAEWKWYLAASVILTIAQDIEMNYLKVEGKNLPFALISILQTATLAGLNVYLLIFAKQGVKGYLTSNLVSYAVSVLVAFIWGRMANELKSAKFNKQILKEMLAYSSPLILNNLSWWVIQSSDKMMIEPMLGASALGLYTVATKVPSLINAFNSIFQQAWGISSINEIESTNDKKFYENVFSIYSTGIFLFCLLLVFVIQPFMSVYVGKSFSSAWRYVPLLLVSAAFSAISTYYGSLYGALKKSVNNMLTTLSSAIINIVLNLIFIRLIGVWGAILGTVVAYTSIAFIRMIDIRRFIPLEIRWKEYLLSCFIVIFQGVVVSLGLHIYICSSVCLIAFVITNRKSLSILLGTLFKKVRK